MIRICQNLSEFFYENLLTMWAKYAIYEAIDKIPEICCMCPYASKENLTLRPSYESVQLDICIFVDNTITNLIVSIVNILHYAPLYSIYKGSRRLYESI